MCVFCEIIAGRMPAYIVSETKYTVSVLDIDPINEGHVLVLPKVHEDSIDKLPSEVLSEMTAEASRLVRALRRTYDIKGYGIMQNGGEFCDFGHCHLHVFPRYRGDGFGFTYPEGKFEYSEEVLYRIKSNLEPGGEIKTESDMPEQSEAKSERLRKQLQFALEIDKEKGIYRQTHLSGHGRRENDAEHAWHMAVMAYLLKEYSNAQIDIERVMIMCLIHDVVEIDAGDTYAYDAEGLKTQKAREEAAKQRIFGILPEEQRAELTEIFEEFEAYETPEAKFAHCLDNVQPLMLNNSNDGADWTEHGVCATQVYGRQGRNKEGSQMLYEYTDAIIRKHILRGHIKE